MDRHALDVLELPAIRERLADETSFAGGRALVDALEPSSDPAEVADRQARTAEAIRLHEAGPPRLGGAEDVRTAAVHAARGGVLTPATLAAVAATIRVALDTRGVLAQRTAEAPLLAETAAVIEPGLGALADRVERAIETDGSGVRDGASPALRGLRRAIADARRRATERLRALAASPGLRSHLQEDFITERNGRPVLAVKASSRSAVPGIVHDSSGSGQTLFVEPFAVVELMNEASEAMAAERDEVERILAELSAGVGDVGRGPGDGRRAPSPRSTSRWRAGLLSRRWGGCPVEPTDGAVELLERAPPAARPRHRDPRRPAAGRPARGRRQRPEHRRQDGGAEDARAWSRCCTSAACDRRRARRGCRSSTRCWRTSATSSRSPRASRPSPATCATSWRSSSRRPTARWC